jgi:hypothetical protein
VQVHLNKYTHIHASVRELIAHLCTCTVPHVVILFFSEDYSIKCYCIEKSNSHGIAKRSTSQYDDVYAIFIMVSTYEIIHRDVAPDLFSPFDSVLLDPVLLLVLAATPFIYTRECIFW